MPTSAARSRQYRERQRHGVRVIHIEVSNDVVDALVETRALAAWDADDADAIAASIEKILTATLERDA
jgi:hypothetical protein